MQVPDPTAKLRRQVYLLLIVVATAMAAGRVLATERVYEPGQTRNPGEEAPRSLWPAKRPRPMPTFSSNDRSRWATVRALVDDSTYVVGRRDPQTALRSALLPLGAAGPLQAVVLSAVAKDYRDRLHGDSGIVFEDGWETLDKVLHPTRLEYYSSKPPLLATLAAGEYWVLQRLTGWTLEANPQEVVRTILLTLNVLPLALYLGLLALLLERYGQSDWGRLYLLSAAAFGTLVTPFLVTFNNHTVATYSLVVALVAAYHQGRPQWAWLWYALAGLAAGFTATNELPALALTAALGMMLFFRSPLRALLAYGPAAALPLIALLATNYLAIGQIRPAYSEFGGPWYQYEGSYWVSAPDQIRRGIDWAWQHESHSAYIFHVLVGHHGWFSLTPIFLLTLAGICLGLVAGFRSNSAPPTAVASNEMEPTRKCSLPNSLFLLTGVVSLVVVGFYLFYVDYRTHNYGGWSAGPRWLMWLTPLWLLSMLPAVDTLARRRWGRVICLFLLALSILAMSYPAWNPWRHPYLYNWLDSRGAIPY
jgi:hypothetical protein